MSGGFDHGFAEMHLFDHGLLVADDVDALGEGVQVIGFGAYPTAVEGIDLLRRT